MFILDIVIVNWNSGKLLENCLNSIASSSYDLKKINVIVVDNASQDKSLELALPDNLSIDLIKLEYNAGFAKACNIGAESSNSKFILFLNPDTEVYHETLDKCINKMISRKDISVLGAKYFDEHNECVPSCSRFPSAINFFYDIFGFSKIFPKIFKGSSVIPVNVMDYGISQPVDEVSGAFFFCRRSFLDKVGLFDEQFFVYFEEMDLAYRVKQAGGVVFYDADISLYHKGEGVSDQVKDKRLFYIVRSRLKFCRKHFSKVDYLLVFLISIFIEPLTRLIRLLIEFRFNEINDLFKGYVLIYKYYITNVLKFLGLQNG